MIKVGDIFYSSWGYDQTNIDFYQVVELKKKGVVIRRIGSESTPEIGFMTAKKTAIKDKFIGEPMLKFPRSGYDGKPSFKLTSYSWAYPWDGEPKTYSWYA